MLARLLENDSEEWLRFSCFPRWDKQLEVLTDVFFLVEVVFSLVLV